MFVGRRTWPVGSVVSSALKSYLEAAPTDPAIPLMPKALGDLLLSAFMKTQMNGRMISRK